MGEERLESVTVDTGSLSPADIESLGDSVLAHALRWREAEDSGAGSAVGNPIASFTDSI